MRPLGRRQRHRDIRRRRRRCLRYLQSCHHRDRMTRMGRSGMHRFHPLRRRCHRLDLLGHRSDLRRSQRGSPSSPLDPCRSLPRQRRSNRHCRRWSRCRRPMGRRPIRRSPRRLRLLRPSRRMRHRRRYRDRRMGRTA